MTYFNFHLHNLSTKSIQYTLSMIEDSLEVKHKSKTIKTKWVKKSLTYLLQPRN